MSKQLRTDDYVMMMTGLDVTSSLQRPAELAALPQPSANYYKTH